MNMPWNTGLPNRSDHDSEVVDATTEAIDRQARQAGALVRGAVADAHPPALDARSRSNADRRKFAIAGASLLVVVATVGAVTVTRWRSPAPDPASAAATPPDHIGFGYIPPGHEAAVLSSKAVAVKFDPPLAPSRIRIYRSGDRRVAVSEQLISDPSERPFAYNPFRTVPNSQGNDVDVNSDSNVWYETHLARTRQDNRSILLASAYLSEQELVDLTSSITIDESDRVGLVGDWTLTLDGTVDLAALTAGYASDPSAEFLVLSPLSRDGNEGEIGFSRVPGGQDLLEVVQTFYGPPHRVRSIAGKEALEWSGNENGSTDYHSQLDTWIAGGSVFVLKSDFLNPSELDKVIAGIGPINDATWATWRANGIRLLENEPPPLEPGMPTVVTDPVATTAGGAPEPTQTSTSVDLGEGVVTYTVQAGDYPIKIGKIFGCDWKVIFDYNKIDPNDPGGFVPGAELRIPPDCGGLPTIPNQAVADPASTTLTWTGNTFGTLALPLGTVVRVVTLPDSITICVDDLNRATNCSRSDSTADAIWSTSQPLNDQSVIFGAVRNGATVALDGGSVTYGAPERSGMTPFAATYSAATTLTVTAAGGVVTNRYPIDTA